MRQKLFKLTAVILVLITVVTSMTSLVYAQTELDSYTLTIDEIKNPLYEETEDTAAQPFAITPRTYDAAGDSFNTDIYISDKNTIASNIRAAMVDRKYSLNVYYVDTVEHTSDSLYEVLCEWTELALAETDNPNEGDYLRYVYSRIGSDSVAALEYEGKYYYHLPLRLGYYTTKAQEQEFDAAIDDVIDDFDFTVYSTPRQKSDAIYEYITDNVEYDYDNLYDNDYTLKYSAYAALINGTAVCQGYATLYYRLARECGLEARVVTGKSFDQNHAWNIVKIGEYYYYLDSTWDAGETKYGYYLKGTGDFDDHTPDDKYLTAAFKQKYPISAKNMDLSDDGISYAFEYEVYMSKAIITKYTGSDKHVIVPATINGYPVDTVGKGAFKENTKVESITFSEGINYLEEDAITYCSNLKQLNFPTTMTVCHEKYGDDTLAGYTGVPKHCYNIETVTVASGKDAEMMVSDGILYTADGADLIFCPPKTTKKQISIPACVTTIAPRAFYGCENIEAVSMANTVKYIGYWAFSTSYNLKKINISNDCRIIGQFALSSTKISEVHIPAATEQILGAAFGSECDLKKITVDADNEIFYMENGALCMKDSKDGNDVILDYETDNTATVFTVPDNIKVIDQYAFAEAENLKEIILHKDVEYIYPYAFEDCTGLTHFEFTENIKKIPDYALIGCENLASVIIPASVTEIGEMLVYDNEGYTIYGEKGSAAESYAAVNSIKFKTIDKFTCTDGHNLKKTFNGEFAYRLVCQNCGDEAKMHYLGDIEAFAQFAKVEYEAYQYTGKAIKPRIAEFEYDGKVFAEGVDYAISGYFNNVNAGTGYIEVKGIGDFAGTGYIYFNITPASIKSKSIGIEYLTTTYDGYEKCPLIVIEGLREFEDFEVRYTNNVEPGTATATIIAFGNYEGTVTVDFEIKPAALGAQLIKDKATGKWYYYYNGVKSNATNLVKINGTWYYIEAGRWAKEVDTLHKINGKWFLVKGGIWKATTGLVEYKGKTFYVKGGKWTSAVNDLIKISGKWYYIKNGKWDNTVESLHKINGKWFLIKDGMWKATTGLVKYKGKYFYVKGGKWSSSVNTLYKKSGKWFAIKSGKWNTGKAIISYDGKKYYVNKGYAQLKYSGKIKIGLRTYRIKNGIVK